MKQAFVSEKNGELTLSIIRDANPRMQIGIDFCLPTIPKFSLELPFPENESANSSFIFNSGLDVLVDQIRVYLNDRGFVEDEILDTIGSMFQALSLYQEEKEPVDEGSPLEVHEIKFPITEGFWNQIQQHEISNKVAADYVNHAVEFELRLQKRTQDQKAKEDAAAVISRFKNNIYKNSPGQMFVVLYDRFGKPNGTARVTNQGLTKFAEEDKTAATYEYMMEPDGTIHDASGEGHQMWCAQWLGYDIDSEVDFGSEDEEDSEWNDMAYNEDADYVGMLTSQGWAHCRSSHSECSLDSRRLTQIHLVSWQKFMQENHASGLVICEEYGSRGVSLTYDEFQSINKVSQVWRVGKKMATTHTADSWKNYVQGEYWLNASSGQAVECDMGDYTHESYANEVIMGSEWDNIRDAMEHRLEELNAMDPDEVERLTGVPIEELQDEFDKVDDVDDVQTLNYDPADIMYLSLFEALTDEAKATLFNGDMALFKKDTRYFFMKHYDEIRVINNNFEVWKLTPSAMSAIIDFALEIGGEAMQADKKTEIMVEEVSTKRWASVPMREFMTMKQPGELWRTHGSVMAGLNDGPYAPYPVDLKHPDTRFLDNPSKFIADKQAMMKVSYVSKCRGHKNSDGELAEWCVKSHSTGKILSSHKTKAEAAAHLKQMHMFKQGLFNEETFNFGPTLNSNKPTPRSYNHIPNFREDEKVPYAESPGQKLGYITKRASENVPAILLEALTDLTDEPEVKGWNGVFREDDNREEMQVPTYDIKARLEQLRKATGLSLPLLGEGSSRCVFDINAHCILKLAKNAAGVAQTEAEYEVYEKVEDCSIITQIFYYAEDFEWLIAEKAVKTATEEDFEEHYGMSAYNLVDAMDGYSEVEVTDPRALQAIKELKFLCKRLDVLSGDMEEEGNWGIVERDGERYPVMIDYGFTYSVRLKHYSSTLLTKDAAEVMEIDNGPGTTREFSLTLDSKFGNWEIDLTVDSKAGLITGSATLDSVDTPMLVSGKSSNEIQQALLKRIDWHYHLLKKDLQKELSEGHKPSYTYQDLELDNAKLTQEMIHNTERYLGPPRPKPRWQ